MEGYFRIIRIFFFIFYESPNDKAYETGSVRFSCWFSASEWVTRGKIRGSIVIANILNSLITDIYMLQLAFYTCAVHMLLSKNVIFCME